VSWHEPSERHHRALDAFFREHPHTGEAVFVTADDFELDLPMLQPEL